MDNWKGNPPITCSYIILCACVCVCVCVCGERIEKREKGKIGKIDEKPVLVPSYSQLAIYTTSRIYVYTELIESEGISREDMHMDVYIRTHTHKYRVCD